MGQKTPYTKSNEGECTIKASPVTIWQDTQTQSCTLLWKLIYLDWSNQLKLTRKKKLSMDVQANFLSTLPIQGAWKVWFRAVWLMSREDGLIRTKGMQIHCKDEEHMTATKRKRCAQIFYKWRQGNENVFLRVKMRSVSGKCWWDLNRYLLKIHVRFIRYSCAF